MAVCFCVTAKALRRILIPQIDFTLLSPSGRYESSTRHALSSTTHSDRVRRPLSGRKKQLGRWKSPIPGRAFQSSLRISETGMKNALPRPLEQSFSRLTRASAALILGPVLQPQYSLSRKLSDNTDVMTERIRKTNLSLQQLSINSNSRYFAPNALPRSFESGRYALPTARFARQTLAVEWKTSTCA